MVLENFRGIEGPREIVFAERGITLVEGPNEAGKSSIAEALRLVRDFKASSQAADVRAVRPTHVQADPRVEIEVRSGPYHLVYAKTFGRKGTTRLTVHAPRPESHTGDAAHDRASAIFAETVDAELWRALHLVQGQPLDQPVLADLEPLHLALAERDAGEGAEVHADVLDRVEAEYLTYFTATGRPTGDYARLRDALDAAVAREREAQAEVENVARLVEKHERLRLRRDDLAVELAEQRKEAQSLRDRSDALDQLRDECREARQVAHGADQSALAARRAQQRRSELLQEFEAAEQALSQAEEAAAAAQAELEELEARPVPGDPDGAIDAAREALDDAAARLDAARAESEWRRAKERLDRARAAVQCLTEASETLAQHSVTADVLTAIGDAHTQWRTAEARSLAGAPQVRIERLGEAIPTVDGAPLAGDTAEMAALRTTVVEVADGVRVTVAPDAEIAERADDAEQARRAYERLLAQVGATDLDDARGRAAQRDEAQRQVDSATAELRAALDGATEAELAADVAALDQRRSQVDDVPEVNEARAAHELAKQRYEHVVRDSQQAREERARRAAVAQALRDRVVSAGADVAQAAARLDRAAAALDAARAEASDDDVAAALERADEARIQALATVEALDRDLREHGADQIAADLATAEEVLGSTERRAQQLAEELVGVDAQLELLGRDGLQDAANRAAEQVADLERRWASMDARARAARRLHTTLAEHAQRARQRYVRPFREAIVDLGRTVFGEGFDVEISDDLAIVSRTLDGRTVPFSSLSGGAREQLGVLGRVATARLVSEESGAPVVLDDALGYADPIRR
ncbi:hypothetical protein D9V41_07965, partial [Aeromicrobium phragmitis]